jgi:ABC-type multidrug transport system fused ATPase/permease subunit
MSHQFAWVVVEAIIRYSQIELSMNAIERVDEYVSMPHEPTSGTSVPANWPSAGLIEIKDLTVAYDIGLPPVLDSLTFTAEPTQSIGVVGRTGAGKSSLTLAIFRMLDIRAGSITIDGIDTSAITLHDLRSRLAIIPQDPVLFSGTLRSNIDPLEQYTDEEVFAGLRRMHLLDEDEEDDEEPAPLTLRKTTTNTSAIVPPPTRAVFHDLSYPISRGGLNLSQGQRQLICLARALISRPKVLILDESTSNLDMATDRKIQRSIREDFAQSTLLVIAHRLSTIADFDKVLVLDKGEVKEFGKPKVLWEMGGGFRDMVQSSGEREGIEAMFRA